MTQILIQALCRRTALAQRPSILILMVFVTGLSLTPSSCASAQSSQELAPNVPTNGAIAFAATPSPNPSTAPATTGQVQVQQLKALVFVATPKKIVKTGISAQGIQIEGVTIPDEAAFRALVSAFLGKRLTFVEIGRLKAAIVAFFRAHDRPAVNVLVPSQDATNGVVQVVLLEARVGTIKVTGNKWFSTESYRDALTLKPGDPISGSQVQADIDWINQNPFREAEIVYSPGATTDLTDVTIQAKDRFPLRVYAGYNDSGTAITGFQRYLAGAEYGNLFGLGHQLAYQFTTSSDGSSLRAHSVTYTAPLPWRDTLTLSGDYDSTQATIPPLTTETGEYWDLTARYAHPLPAFAHLTQKITMGFDFKHNRNSLIFGGLPVSNTPADIDQFVLGYNGMEKDRLGQTTVVPQIFASPGGMMGDNTDGAFQAVRLYSKSQYAYGNLAVRRETRLPGNLSWVERGTFQIATANLQPSEELGFGGADSVRGYDEREVNADNGYIINTEIYAPPVTLGALLHRPELGDQLSFLVFWDYSGAYDERVVPGDPNARHLSSVGPGLRYVIGTHFSMSFDYGFQFHQTGLDDEHGSRGEVSIVASY